MPRYDRRYAKRTYGRDYGRERALQHIEDAKRLSHELGGTDEDVKRYFFSLPGSELTIILAEYGRRYGSQAREYASDTMHKWRTGQTKMSGTVAERLFNLLPPRMPLSEKYKLTEGLWHHFGPSSKRVMRVGLDADLEQVIELARRHIDEVVTQYRIPEQIERRFNWLAAGDVGVKQELLNHLRSMERTMVVEAARAQMPVLLEHIKGQHGGRTSRLAQVVKVGKHELELLIDKTVSGVRLEAPGYRTPSAANSGGGGKLALIVIAGLVLLFYLLHK